MNLKIPVSESGFLTVCMEYSKCIPDPAWAVNTAAIQTIVIIFIKAKGGKKQKSVSMR